MTLELEKEKVQARFSVASDANYSPISRFEHIPKEDQEDLLAGDAGFYAIYVEATFEGETHSFVSQGMIMSHDDEERQEEFETFVLSDGGLLEDVIKQLKSWKSGDEKHPRWSK